MRIKIALRDFLVCLSLANLILMKVWLQLLPFDSGKSFWLAHSLANNYLAAMINTILIGLGLWCAVLIANCWQGSAMALWPFLYVITLCFTLNGLRSNYGWGIQPLYGTIGKGGALLAVSAAFLLVTGMAFWMMRYRHMVNRLYFRVPLVLAPFILVTFGQSARALRQVEPESAFIPHAHQNFQTSENAHAIPVVWIIFDELDYGIVFGRRPKGLLLPELDRLQQTSLYATHAYSPFDETKVSIPALLTGKVLKLTKSLNAAEMTLAGADGTTSCLQSEATIFTDMHTRGGKTALFGWYFPYSRLFSTVDTIKNYPGFSYPVSERLAKTVVLQLRSLIESGYFSLFGDSLAARNHILITASMHKDVKHYLQTNQSGFAFLHYPVPHALNIYNRRTHRYGSNRNVKEGYLDNLVLVDLLLGEIRTTMQKAGTWDKALILVSADHHWRINTYDGIIDKQRVPFMVKMPYQKNTFTVDKRFETVRTRDLITQIVDGKLKNPEDVSRWMTGETSGNRLPAD